MRQPDFDNLLAVLAGEKPSRPTLFEFFLNDRLCKRLAGWNQPTEPTADQWPAILLRAFAAAGYDYACLHAATGFSFQRGAVADHGASRSMDDQAIIFDRASFEAYAWPDPDTADYSRLDQLGAILPAKMKLIAFSSDGVLENVMGLCGFEHLCYMIADDPDLARDVFDAVGSRLLRYYEICCRHPAVGALFGNDDWGFGTQTMLAPADLRRYVFPWHRRIVQTIHAAGKPAILHSCGALAPIMDEIIDDLGYDAKHSYEDKIMPVEQAYERWHGRIAILGGLDVDFVCRAAPDAVRARAAAMLRRTADRGGYALGTGNSVPYYVPDENYLAMIAPAVGEVQLAAASA